MNTAKFRGKSLSTGEWVYGYLLNFTGDDGNMGCYIFEDNSSEFYSIPEMLIEVDPNTVGQYIGKKDKNGKEAYIGDISKSFFGDNIGIIEWHKTNPWIVLRYVDSRNGIYSFDHLSLEAFEIIGNLTDNPDLLTQ